MLIKIPYTDRKVQVFSYVDLLSSSDFIFYAILQNFRNNNNAAQGRCNDVGARRADFRGGALNGFTTFEFLPSLLSKLAIP